MSAMNGNMIVAATAAGIAIDHVRVGMAPLVKRGDVQEENYPLVETRQALIGIYFLLRDNS